MSPTVKIRSCCRLAVCVVALALAGCGVADYEKKMQEAEVRIQRIDEENRLLGDPLDVPAPPAKSPAINVFLRPPKGIAPAVSKKGEIPYHYSGVNGVCTDVYLAISDDQDKAEKLIEETFGVAGLDWKLVPPVNPPGRPPIAFKAVEFNDPNNTAAVFDAYVHQAPGQPGVGVVFRILRTNREAALPSLQMSLETYAEQNDVATARNNYGKRKAK